jgi:hypothetical protein
MGSLFFPELESFYLLATILIVRTLICSLHSRQNEFLQKGLPYIYNTFWSAYTKLRSTLIRGAIVIPAGRLHLNFTNHSIIPNIVVLLRMLNVLD